MNNRHRSEHSISQVELERLIEQYFDCELSSEQEQWLLHELSVTTLSSEAIDEARFAMGYMSVARKVVDNQEVMSIIKGDLSEMGSAHDAIDSHVLNELSAMGNALP